MRASAAIGPVTVGDVKPFEGKLVPERTKENWLERVLEADGQRSAAAIDVTGIALTFWNVGLQLSTLVAADVRLPPSVVEAVLFGNAGRTGEPADVSLADVWVEGYAATTVGFSLALPIPVLDESLGQVAAGSPSSTPRPRGGGGSQRRFAVGADAAGRPRQFPDHTRVTDDLDIADYVNGGSGIGLDLGLMLSLDRLFVGAAVHNLFNTFAWDESLLTYRRVTAAFKDGSFDFDHGTQAYAAAREEAQELIAELTFKPALRLGVAYLPIDALTISSDVHYRFGDGIALDPQFHLGLGLEYRPIDFLHLRGGLAVVTGGVRFGGGLSLILGPVNLSAAVAGQPGGVIGQIGLSFGNPLPQAPNAMPPADASSTVRARRRQRSGAGAAATSVPQARPLKK